MAFDPGGSSITFGCANSVRHPPHPPAPSRNPPKGLTCFAEPRSLGHDPFPEVYPEWITITYVCRHWRAVALNHHSLWGTITPNLSLTWLKALMARSDLVPVDVELRVGQMTVKRIYLCIDEAIALLSDCTRLRSLRLVGARRDVCAVLDAMRTPTPIHSLSLSLWEPGPPVFLSENLFGGQAPIRHISFAADRCIVPPRWLLGGITHFTSCEQIALLDLFDALRQMPALTHFTLQHCRAQWEDSDAPRDPLVELPHLEELIVQADSPRYFVLLNQRLALPQGAKRRLELRTLAVAGWGRWLRWFTALLPNIKSANGLQHVYLCGGAKDGTFRAWTGDAATSFKDAKLGLHMYWYGSPTTPTTTELHFASPIFHLGELCDLLGATKNGHFLVLEGDPAQADLPASCWWRLLEKLPAVEKLELHPNAVKALCSALDNVAAPALLPMLQSAHLINTDTATSSVIATTIAESRPHMATGVRKGFISRIVPSKVTSPDCHLRTVAWVPNTYGTDDVLPLVVQSTGVCAENSLEGLMTLLRRGAGRNRR